MKTSKIICVNCGTAFLFGLAEERALRTRFGALFRPPTRCPSCRGKRRARRRNSRTTGHDTRYDDAAAMGTPFYSGYWDEYDERS